MEFASTARPGLMTPTDRWESFSFWRLRGEGRVGGTRRLYRIDRSIRNGRAGPPLEERQRLPLRDAGRQRARLPGDRPARGAVGIPGSVLGHDEGVPVHRRARGLHDVLELRLRDV